MILGRNAGLWAALIQAALNVAAAVVVVSTGHDLTPAAVALVAAANALGLALVGVIANASDPTTLPTFARTLTGTGGMASGARLTLSGPVTPAPSVAPDAPPATAGGNAGGGPQG